MKRFVIIANGPFLAQNIIIEAIQDRIIVALDGAADTLLLLNITPDIIVGDFDSIHPKTQAYWGITNAYASMAENATPYPGHHGTVIVPTKDQSETDLTKAIRYCDQQQANDIIILCATGGREDLHEATKVALQTEYRQDRPIIVHGEQQSLCWAKNEVVTLHGEPGDYCGFVAQSSGYGRADGLCYPCDDVSMSLANQLATSMATLDISGEALIILPPQLNAQREVMIQDQRQQVARVDAYFGHKARSA